MSEKSLKSLILKIVKRVIKKEINNLTQDNLSIITGHNNPPLASFIETVNGEEKDNAAAAIIDNIYTDSIVNLSRKADLELERKLRELKFKQELRKDWILFILKDVVVYSTTVLFLFVVSGFYLFTLIHG
jgi:hypothetical protein